MKTVNILTHKLVRIIFDGNQHRVYIALSKGGWLEHNPFPGDLRGLVAAMSLATDCLAGKFYPMGVVPSPGEEKPALKALAAPGPGPKPEGATYMDHPDGY